MALKFVTAKEVANNEGIKFKRPAEGEKSLNGEMLGTLTMLTFNRFIEQVDWDMVTLAYLSGLVDEEDRLLIKRALEALVTGGAEYAPANVD